MSQKYFIKTKDAAKFCEGNDRCNMRQHHNDDMDDALCSTSTLASLAVLERFQTWLSLKEFPSTSHINAFSQKLGGGGAEVLHRQQRE